MDFFAIGFGFDTIDPEYKAIIEEDGTLINSERYDRARDVTVGCSYGVNHGVHEFRIKSLHDFNSHSAIGITSNIQVIANAKASWLNKYDGYKYWWYETNAIFTQTGEVTTNRQIIPNKWGKKDIISVRVNCVDWKVGFYVNNKMFGQEIEIEKNHSYYLVVAFQNIGVKYKLLFP